MSEESSLRTWVECGRIHGIRKELTKAALLCGLQLNVETHTKGWITEFISFEVRGPIEGVNRFRSWLKDISD